MARRKEAETAFSPTGESSAASPGAAYCFGVCIAQNALRQFRDTPVYKTLTSVFAKIRDSLPDKTSVNPAWMDERILLFPEPATRVSPKIWETLAKASRDNKRVLISHVAPGEKTYTERKIDPYYLVNYKNEWYVSSYRCDFVGEVFGLCSTAGLCRFLEEPSADPVESCTPGIRQGTPRHTSRYPGVHLGEHTGG